MRPGQAPGFVLLALATLGLNGCMGALGVLAAPGAVAVGAAGGVGTRVLNAGGGPVSDLDRIIATHPESANSGELRALRDSLIEQGVGADAGAATAAVPVDEFDRHARPSRRLRGDHVKLETTGPTGTHHGPPQRVEPRPFANARISSLPPDERRWYEMRVTPVRLPASGDERRASRGER